QHIISNFQLDKTVSITLEVNPPGAGVVKISTVVPQTLPWTGIYFHGNPVTLTAIPNPGYSFSNWSVNPYIVNTAGATFTSDVANNTTFTANFNGSAQDISLSVSEINYHSDPTRDAGDWFEIRNSGTTPLDISDFSVKDKDWFHRFDVPTGTAISPGGRLVFFENEGKFTTENPGLNAQAGPLPFKLDDGSDELHLFDRSGVEIASAAYTDDKPWPCTPDGSGRTLERTAANTDPGLPGSWFDGCVGGSPGTEFSPCAENPAITEINYKSAAAADAGDWFELYNRQSSPLDLSGWQIRDSGDDNVFVVPAGTVLPSGGYRVFYQDEARFSAQFPGVINKTGPIGFGLSGDGDLIRLYDANGRLQVSLCFNDAAPWPEAPDGGGYTLEIEDINARMNDPLNWFAGCPGGSPGTAYDPGCASTGAEAPAARPHTLRIFPNPASGEIFVRTDQTGGAQVRMFDVLGTTVLEQPATGGITRLQTMDLPAGIYWIEVHSNDGRQMGKVVVQ
ncbi:MAG TPA: lamin tail domain-containing protein, partial [Saprospiraceae bacterium]|nr:lamin tail domain-containing protein [Saprospiraceae bacterium]